MFLFFLGFLRFILFYIYYICKHFGSWIFYTSHLFSSFPIWVICSLYSIFCMYAHLPNFFYPSINLSCLFIILLICVDMCYYTYFVSSFLYLCNFYPKFFTILFMLFLLPHFSICLKNFIIMFMLVLLPHISLCLNFFFIL